MFTYLTGKQVTELQKGKTADDVAREMMMKFTPYQMALDLVKIHQEKQSGIYSDKLYLTTQQKEVLQKIFSENIFVRDIPTVANVPEKKPRKKVEYSKAELEYKTAFMNNVIIPCKGKTEAEKTKIKAAAEKILKPLREAADKAKEARHNKENK